MFGPNGFSSKWKCPPRKTSANQDEFKMKTGYRWKNAAISKTMSQKITGKIQLVRESRQPRL
jgi:hypothetical protein